MTAVFVLLMLVGALLGWLFGEVWMMVFGSLAAVLLFVELGTMYHMKVMNDMKAERRYEESRHG